MLHTTLKGVFQVYSFNLKSHDFMPLLLKMALHRLGCCSTDELYCIIWGGDNTRMWLLLLLSHAISTLTSIQKEDKSRQDGQNLLVMKRWEAINILSATAQTNENFFLVVSGKNV